MGPKISPHSQCQINVFFPIQKDFSQSYKCSALIIAPENKIFMIKGRVVSITVKKITLLFSFSNYLPNNFHNFR